MNTTLKQQIDSIVGSRRLLKILSKYYEAQDINFELMDSALNDAGSTIAALNLSDPYKEIERLKAEKLELEKQLAHNADVNQNQ